MSGFFEWPSRSALNWLERLYSERFGIEVRLAESDGGTSLTVPEVLGEILFECDKKTFSSDGADAACGWWDGEFEGVTPPLGLALPMMGKKEPIFNIFRRDDNRLLVNFDLPGFVYWMLSRREEIGRGQRDIHDRFKADASHAFRYGYLDRPVVDEWLIVLRELMRIVFLGVKFSEHAFHINVSHDVDSPSLYGFCSPVRMLRRMAGSVIRDKDIKGALMAPWIRYKTRDSLCSADPKNTFDWIMANSESRGLVSSFYFICGKTDLYRDADYSISHPAIRSLIRDIHRRGHEVGLHPSYNTYLNGEALQREYEYLRSICAEEKISQDSWGGRMHFLRWSHPQTLRIWDNAGLNYDSTLGYAEWPGFRCGTCFDYPAFDPEKGEALALRIRPLIVMEGSVLSEQYLGLGSRDEAYQLMVGLKERCRQVSGCFNILWHNSSFPSMYERDLYLAVLDA